MSLKPYRDPNDPNVILQRHEKRITKLERRPGVYPGPKIPIWSDSVNGWENSWDDPHVVVGGGNIYLYERSWFRIILGGTGHERQAFELQLAADGGTPGSTMFTLPDGYYDWCDGLREPRVYVKGPNGNGVGICWVDGANGRVVDVAPEATPGTDFFNCTIPTISAASNDNASFSFASGVGLFDLTDPTGPTALHRGVYSATISIGSTDSNWSDGSSMSASFLPYVSYFLPDETDAVGGSVANTVLNLTWGMGKGQSFLIQVDNNDLANDHDFFVSNCLVQLVYPY